MIELDSRYNITENDVEKWSREVRERSRKFVSRVEAKTTVSSKKVRRFLSREAKKLKEDENIAMHVQNAREQLGRANRAISNGQKRAKTTWSEWRKQNRAAKPSHVEDHLDE